MDYGFLKCVEQGAGLSFFNIQINGEHTMTCRAWIKSGAGQEVAGRDEPSAMARESSSHYEIYSC
jgi:hypothetical protein